MVPASLLALPASFDDDLTLLALPLAWLAGAGEDEGFLPWERTILVVLWCLPLAARLIARLTGIVLAPAAMVALLALVLIRSWRAWRGGPGPLSLGGARS